MNLFDQLNKAFDSEFRVVAPKKPTRRGTNKPWLVQQNRAIKKYRDLLTGKKLTTSEISSAVGISHMGALTYLYSLEKRGFVRRAGILPRSPWQRPGRGQIIWTWNEKEAA